MIQVSIARIFTAITYTVCASVCQSSDYCVHYRICVYFHFFVGTTRPTICWLIQYY